MLAGQLPFRLITVWLGTQASAGLQAVETPEAPWREGVKSPRMEALKKAGSAGAVRFWEEMKAKGTPLVETIAGDPGHVLLTFVYRGEARTKRVVLLAQLGTTRGAVNVLTRMPGTDVWYKTYQFRHDMRFSYSFGPEPKPPGAPENGRVRDPLNPKGLEQGAVFGNSIVELPGAPPQPWNDARPGVAAGKLDEVLVESSILRSRRKAWVYTPAAYDANRPAAYPVLVCFDGNSYHTATEMPVPAILDNLIAAGKIPPMISVLVGQSPQPGRNLELSNNPTFISYVADELLPYVRKKWRATAEPAQTIVTGSSAGGLGSIFAAFRRPNVFGNVLSQSGALWPGKERDNPEHEWLTRQYEASPKLPVRFVLQVGVLEIVATPLDGPSILTANRHLRDVLQARGYELHYHEIAGGHEPLSWRGGLADGLIELMGN